VVEMQTIASPHDTMHLPSLNSHLVEWPRRFIASMPARPSKIQTCS
jgi:hypothetical protein